MEDALIEVQSMRRFAAIDLISDRIPEESTIISFLHRLEQHDLGKQVFETVKALLNANGMVMKQITGALRRGAVLAALHPLGQLSASAGGATRTRADGAAGVRLPPLRRQVSGR